MHPVIRICCFLVFCGFVVFGNQATIIAAYTVFTVLIFKRHIVDLANYFAQLKRLKWLFLSILLLYLWFTPGQPLLLFLPSLSPSVEGLQLGIERVSALILVVFTLHVLIKNIPQHQLILAILWLLRPLNWLGLPQTSLAVRISLVLQVLDEVQAICAAPTSNREENSTTKTKVKYTEKVKSEIDAVVERVTSVFMQVIKQADCMLVQEVEVTTTDTGPPMYQWLAPVLLVAVFILLKQHN